MALSLVGGAAVGALFGALYDVVKISIGRTAMQYKPLLSDLKFTLDSLRPRIIQQIGEHNVELGIPNEDVESLQRQMEDGTELVRMLSNRGTWNCYILCSCCNCNKPSYAEQLVELDRSLRILLEILKLQEARDVKEVLLLARKINDKQGELERRLADLLKVQQESGDGGESSGSGAETTPNEQNGENGGQQVAPSGGGVGAAALGAAFGVLFDTVMHVKDKTTMLKRPLGDLRSTLDSVKPLIEEVAECSKVLNLPNEELEDVRIQMEKGAELVSNCSKVRQWTSYKTYEYTNKLLGLDESLQRLLTVLRVQLARDVRESLVSVSNIEAVINQIEGSGVVKLQNEQNEAKDSCEAPTAMAKSAVGLNALRVEGTRDVTGTLDPEANIKVGLQKVEENWVAQSKTEHPSRAVGLNALSVEGTRDVTETLDLEANIKVGWQKVEESWVAQSKTEHPSRTVGLDAMNIQVEARSMEETSVSDVEAGLKRIQGKEVYELDAPFRELKEDVLKDEEDEELDEQVEDHHDRKKKGAESVTGASGDRMPSCKADGCAVDLSDAKAYNRRHRVCELHSKAPLVIVSGLKRRFCHKCSRFHDLSEFDDTKQSCRRHLPYIERDGTGTQLKDVSGDTDTVISQIERSAVVQSQNDQSEIKDLYEVVKATPPAVGLNVPSVQGTRDSKETLQNTELGLKQIQGKEVFDSEPPYAEYKETEYVPPSVTIGMDVLLRGLKRFLLNEEVSAVVLTGPGGSGKTTLAKFFCEDEEVKNIFKNNIFFVHVSENPNLSIMVQTLYQQIGFQIPALQDESIALHWLHQFLMETALHPSVLVLDDVWPGSESLLDKFDEFKTPNYKIMVTSRYEFPAFGFPYYLKPLNAEDEMTLSHYSPAHIIELLDDEDLICVSPPPITFDDEGPITHFPDSPASYLGDGSSHVSTAIRPMDQFHDPSASTLGDKSSYVPKDAGTTFEPDNPVKSTQTYMQQKLELMVSASGKAMKKVMTAVHAIKGDDSVVSSQAPRRTSNTTPLAFKNVEGDDSVVSSQAPSRTSNTTPLAFKNVEDLRQSPGYINVSIFTYNEMSLATKRFRRDLILGKGGFGVVYKGIIYDNVRTGFKTTEVAIKVLNRKGFEGDREWLAEVNYLGQLSYPTLVKLIGYCCEDDHRLLVYEYMAKGSLANHLFRRVDCTLTWSRRMKIALDAAKGLAFLHGAERPIIHRNFTTSNILLDGDFNAKLSDLGVAREGPMQTHVSTRVIGTYGYIAPEYVMTGHLTARCDVYGFGVVLLELLTGLRAIDMGRHVQQHNLVEWARPLLNHNEKLQKIVDPRLEGQYSLKSAMKVANLAYQCLSQNPKGRPLMSQVVETLDSLQTTGNDELQSGEGNSL